MDIQSFIKFYRLGFGILILVAVIAQFLTFRQKPINFFSYFTVLSSLFVSFVFISSAFNVFESIRLDILRGAATLYILTAGLGLIILLGGRNDEFVAWINIVLHYLAPIAVLADWIFTPSTKIPLEKALTWIIVMLIYLAYSLVRGSITSWYPYNFLNPTVIGVKGVAIYTSMLTIATLLLSWTLTKIGGLGKFNF